jgi:hypothetical protein
MDQIGRQEPAELMDDVQPVRNLPEINELLVRERALARSEISYQDCDTRQCNCLHCGDLIGVATARQLAFRIVWKRVVGLAGKANVAVKRLESDICLWEDTLASLVSPADCS